MACSCKSKRRKSKLSGMKKSDFKIVGSGLKTAGGFAAGRIVSNVSFFASNPYLAAAAQVAGAVVLAGMGKGFKEMAIGMAASGAIDAVKTVAPGAASQIGLGGINVLPASPMGSTQLPGVAGAVGEYNYAPDIMVE